MTRLGRPRRLLFATTLAMASLTIAVGPIGHSPTLAAHACACDQCDGPQDSPLNGVETNSRSPRMYMGRPIADVMSWQGVEWLFRETRIKEEQPEKMLSALKIPRGATVADVGAGAGFHSIRMARRVGPKGTVLATDVQPEMLEMLRGNARQAGVTNIKRILVNQADSGLPTAAVDLILMVDVYHECADPEATLKGLFKALKPRGRLVLVEFRGEDPDVPIKPEHKMTLRQVRREVEPQGFLFKDSLEFLPWQHVIIFEKPGAANESRRPTRTKEQNAPPNAKAKAQ